MIFNFFKKKTQIHEPIKLQAKDVMKLNPLVAKEIINGLSCDKLPNSSGGFGSITNPIPVNGPLGEIKYLGKLRGKTGHAVFFHRIGSINTDIANYPLDIFELVCLDGTQWNKLYFDMYHPRRSDIAPNGYFLTRYEPKLKMDIPFAYGVNSFVSDFPNDIPIELKDLYGGYGAYSRHAKKWLSKYSFKRPTDVVEDISFSEQKKIKSTNDIDNFSFITEIIKESLGVEKNIFVNKKNDLKGYSNSEIFNPKYNRKFFIERFIFFRAYVEWEEITSINTDDMYRYVAAVATKVYDITHQQSYEFMNSKQRLYYFELCKLTEQRNPNPGKIIWCLQNPMNSLINQDAKFSLENNITASIIFFEAILNVFKNSLSNFSISRN